MKETGFLRVYNRKASYWDTSPYSTKAACEAISRLLRIESGVYLIMLI